MQCITDSDTGMHIKFCMGQRIHDLVLVNGGGQKQYALVSKMNTTKRSNALSCCLRPC